MIEPFATCVRNVFTSSCRIALRRTLNTRFLSETRCAFFAFFVIAICGRYYTVCGGKWQWVVFYDSNVFGTISTKKLLEPFGHSNVYVIRPLIGTVINPVFTSSKISIRFCASGLVLRVHKDSSPL